MTLECYKTSCRGVLQACEQSDECLFRCDECNASIKQSAVETLADDTGPVAQLANVLLETAATEDQE